MLLSETVSSVKAYFDNLCDESPARFAHCPLDKGAKEVVSIVPPLLRGARGDCFSYKKLQATNYHYLNSDKSVTITHPQVAASHS